MASIGVFDSGFGGLTVLREIMRAMPNEDTIFVGDSARCPYGPRDLGEVRGFVLEICNYLVSRGCKMIVIACNTGTAAGLQAAQMTFDIPIVGVVEPGARAAVHMTHNRRVGVIATEGTVRSGAYENAIHHLEAGIEVFSKATPEFVRIAESDIRSGALVDEEASYEIAHRYLDPLVKADVDTLVLGCTHFPLIEPMISDVVGNGVTLVSSAEETARDVELILQRRGELNDRGNLADVSETATSDRDTMTSRDENEMDSDAMVTYTGAVHEFLTTGSDLGEFARFAGLVLGADVDKVDHISFA